MSTVAVLFGACATALESIEHVDIVAGPGDPDGGQGPLSGVRQPSIRQAS